VGTVTLAGLTGEGSNLFAGGSFVAVTDVEVFVTAHGPKQREIGIVAPIGLWQVGEVFLGYSSSGLGTPESAHAFFIHHEGMDEYISSAQGLPFVYFDMIWWRLNAGVTVTLKVNW
jgi:hypothetical protein